MDIRVLINDVSQLLGMNNDSTPLLQVDDIDALSLDEVVRTHLVAATRYIEERAPLYLLDPGKPLPLTSVSIGGGDDNDDLPEAGDGEEMENPGGTGSGEMGGPVGFSLDEEEPQSRDREFINWDQNGVGYIPLPADFMRLVGFKMNDWRRPALVIHEDDPRYALQSSQWGLKGDWESPVVAIVRYPYSLTLEVYSRKNSSSEVTSAHYRPLPEIIANDLDISQRLVPAVEYYAAYLTSLSYSNPQQASYYLQQALTLAQIETAQKE